MRLIGYEPSIYLHIQAGDDAGMSTGLRFKSQSSSFTLGKTFKLCFSWGVEIIIIPALRICCQRKANTDFTYRQNLKTKKNQNKPTHRYREKMDGTQMEEYL